MSHYRPESAPEATMRPSTPPSSPHFLPAPIKLLATGLVLTYLVVMPVLAAGKTADPPSFPGYLDFEELGIDTTSEDIRIEVNLQGPVLAFVTEAMRSSEPELAEALAKIHSIHFQMIRLPEEQQAKASQRARSLADRLEGQGWQRIVRIQQDGVLSYLHLLMRGNQIHGLTVMFLQEQDNNFGFINMAGEIDPAQLGRIGQQFNIDVLESAQRQLESEPSTPPSDQD